jgi:hypothetical protein
MLVSVNAFKSMPVFIISKYFALEIMKNMKPKKENIPKDHLKRMSSIGKLATDK